MKDKRLRYAWIGGNIFCYVMFFGFSSFVALNVDGLADINRLSIWVIAMLFLFFVCVFGTVQIRGWIKQGRI
ncbi:hypothetical protein [Bacillus sp. AK031]